MLSAWGGRWVLSALRLGQGPCQQHVQAGLGRELGARQGWQPAGVAGRPLGVCEQQEPSRGRWRQRGEDREQREVTPSAARPPCWRRHHPCCQQKPSGTPVETTWRTGGGRDEGPICEQEGMPAAQLGRHQEGLFGDLGLRPALPVLRSLAPPPFLCHSSQTSSTHSPGDVGAPSPCNGVSQAPGVPTSPSSGRWLPASPSPAAAPAPGERECCRACELPEVLRRKRQGRSTRVRKRRMERVGSTPLA